MTDSKKFWLTLGFTFMALAILTTTYIANGSELKDAWLYIFFMSLVLYPSWEAYSQRKVKN